MWFWKRVEIYNGFSLKEFSDLRDSLISAGIRYDYKRVDRNSNTSNRVRFGTLGQDARFTIQYYLYVHHKDYENAMFLTSNRNY
ncbi:MAG: hypothetical protein K0S01_3183 [Herbinix sp.]|jgi:hypothetical protein|nr:hypothetical protein [Herbinix sp.]